MMLARPARRGARRRSAAATRQAPTAPAASAPREVDFVWSAPDEEPPLETRGDDFLTAWARMWTAAFVDLRRLSGSEPPDR